MMYVAGSARGTHPAHVLCFVLAGTHTPTHPGTTHPTASVSVRVALSFVQLLLLLLFTAGRVCCSHHLPAKLCQEWVCEGDRLGHWLTGLLDLLDLHRQHKSQTV